MCVYVRLHGSLTSLKHVHVQKKSACTAVYLTQMFLLDLKCLFVLSGLAATFVSFEVFFAFYL